MNLIGCCNCGAPIALLEDHETALRRDSSKYFYCPHGHSQHFSQSELDRVKAKLEEQTRIATRMAERALAAELAEEVEAKKRAAAERDLRRIKTRAAGGVCPCCNRTFVQLGRHMKTKHPEVA